MGSKIHIKPQQALDIIDCAIDVRNQLSAMCPLMGVKSNPGTADAGAYDACPDTEVAKMLSPELADCSFCIGHQTDTDFANNTKDVTYNCEMNPHAMHIMN